MVLPVYMSTNLFVTLESRLRWDLGLMLESFILTGLLFLLLLSLGGSFSSSSASA